MADGAPQHSRCCCSSASCSDEEDLLQCHATPENNIGNSDSTSAVPSESHTFHESSASLGHNCPERLQPYQVNFIWHDVDECGDTMHHGGSVLSTRVTENSVPPLSQPQAMRSDDICRETFIDSARSQISPSILYHKHGSEVTVAADDARFVDVLFQGVRIFSTAKVEILIVRHKRNRLLEVIVCTDGARVEVGHFYVRHEDLLSVVSQKDIHARLSLAVQSWTDGLPDIRSLLRCATTNAQVEYLLGHLDVSSEMSHHGLTNLVAHFVPDEASGKQLPPMVLTEKPAQVPKLRWQPSITGMETIDEDPECRSRRLCAKRAPAGDASRPKEGENTGMKVHAAVAGVELEDCEGVRVKPHRHTSVFSYFSPFSTQNGSARTQTSEVRACLEAEDKGDVGVRVGMFQQLLKAMRVQSMRVLPTDTTKYLEGQD